jgi:hypothetical protein
MERSDPESDYIVHFDWPTLGFDAVDWNWGEGKEGEFFQGEMRRKGGHAEAGHPEMWGAPAYLPRGRPIRCNLIRECENFSLFRGGES